MLTLNPTTMKETGKRDEMQPEMPLQEAKTGIEAQIEAVDVFSYDDTRSNEFYLPVHGFVWFTDAEIRIINHPAFQRLGDINQLGQAHLVFRGATHKRIEHVLGTVHVAQLIIDEVKKNHRRITKNPSKSLARDRELCSKTFSAAEHAFIRLASLLHDIGHLPAGHTLEDEIKLFNKHESVERLDAIFERKDWNGNNPSDPQILSLREVVDDAYKGVLPRGTSSPTEIVYAIIAKYKKGKEPKIKLPDDFQLQICRDIVGNTICADFLDYIHRDWYHLGKARYFDTRLFQYMELRKDKNNESAFVISLGERSKLRSDAITSIVNLLDSRYQLAETVLFHRTKCAAAAMLERGIQELRFDEKIEDKVTWDKKLENNFLDHSDSSLLKFLLKMADDATNPAAALPLRSLLNREIYTPIFTVFFQEVEPHFNRLIEKYILTSDTADAPAKAEVARSNRLNAMRFLEEDFGLPSGSLVMYFPTKSMNAKIPQVKIHVDGDIQTFEDWNTTDQTKLDGGLLKAQIIRFSRLWRTHICIRKTELEKLKKLKPKLKLLKDAIRVLVFDCETGQTASDAALELAERAKSTSGMPYSTHSKVLALVGKRKTPTIAYPFGAPRLRDLFSEK